jgi:hypothetical protein
VVFDKDEHTYTLNGNLLHGITGMLSRQLFADKYKDIPAFVLQRAAERGTMIHEDCEFADATGLEPQTTEGRNYLELRKDFTVLCNEYTVSDNEYFASNIDCVWEKDGEVVLADIKTTSHLDEEYVAWQLSIYAYFFETMNPDIKVRDLYAIHIRDGKAKLVKVPRVSQDKVINLLADEILDAPVKVVDTTLPSMPDQYKEMQWDIREMMEFYVETKEKLDAIKARLLEELDAAELTKWQGDMLTFTRKADSSRETFDTKRFKAEHPDLYRQYTMITNTRGSVSITINK